MAGSRKVVDAYVQLSARGISAVEGGLQRVQGVARGAYGALSNIAQIAIGNTLSAGLNNLLSAAASIPGRMISANAAFESASVTMEVLLGSAEKAKERIADLAEFAAKTPYEMPGILLTSKQLEMANIPAEKHMEVLRMTGDMAAAAGVDISDLGMWVSRAYASIQGGKPWGEAAMRLQELGVLSVDARARLEKMSEEGASSTEVWAAFQAEMARFNGMMEKQSATFSGLMSTMSDGVREVLKTAGAPLFEGAKSIVEQVVGVLAAPETMEAAAAFGSAFVSGLEAAGQFFAPLVSLAGELLSNMWGLFDAATESGSAFSGLGGVIQSSMELGLSVGIALFDILTSISNLIWDGLVAGLGMFGIEIESKGELANSVFATMHAWIDTISAGIRNWDLSLQYAWIYLQNFGDNFKAVLSAVWENIKIIFTNFPEYVKAGVQAAVTIMGNLATNVQIAFQWVFDWIESWFKGDSGSWGEAIAKAVQKVWDGMTWLIDQVWGGLKKLWDAVTSGFTKGLDIAKQNYTDGINNSTDENGKPKLEFIPITQGVEDAFKDLPDLVEPDIKDARDRYGSELDKLDQEWNQREAERKKKAEKSAKDTEKAISEAVGPQGGTSASGGPDDGAVATGAAAKALEASKKSGDKKKESDKAGDLVSAESMWSRIQKAAMEGKETKKAEKQRDTQIAEQKQANEHLKKIADASAAGAVFA